MAKKNLTDLIIRSLPTPVKGQKTYWDDALPGFGIRLSQGGSRTWIVLDPRARIRTQQTIGRYPVIGLRDARAAARHILAERTLRRYVPSTKRWDSAVSEYLEQLKKQRRASTHGYYKHFLHKHFRFGDAKLCDITTNDLEHCLDQLHDRKGSYAYSFSVVRAFLHWCQRRRYLDQNPLDPLRSPYKYEPRKRALDGNELAAVWHAAGRLGLYGKLVRILILTGQRRGECSNLTPKMDKGDRIILPGWLTKNGKEHTFPIGHMTRGILDTLTGSLYFPAAGTTDVLMSGWSKMKRRLDKLSGVSDWTIHDLRRTLRTNWAALGIQKEIAKRYINHIGGRSTNDMDEVYDQYSYFPEMVAAVRKWEQFLEPTFADQPTEAVGPV